MLTSGSGVKAPSVVEEAHCGSRSSSPHISIGSTSTGVGGSTLATPPPTRGDTGGSGERDAADWLVASLLLMSTLSEDGESFLGDVTGVPWLRVVASDSTMAVGVPGRDVVGEFDLEACSWQLSHGFHSFKFNKQSWFRPV